MTAVLILFMFVAFVGIDLLVRTNLRRIQEKRERQAREAVLNTSIRLDFTHTASLNGPFPMSVCGWLAHLLLAATIFWCTG